MEEIILTRENVWTLYNSIRETKSNQEFKINHKRLSKEEKEKIKNWLAETNEVRELIGNLIDLMQMNNTDTIKISFYLQLEGWKI